MLSAVCVLLHSVVSAVCVLLHSVLSAVCVLLHSVVSAAWSSLYGLCSSAQNASGIFTVDLPILGASYKLGQKLLQLLASGVSRPLLFWHDCNTASLQYSSRYYTCMYVHV